MSANCYRTVTMTLHTVTQKPPPPVRRPGAPPDYAVPLSDLHSSTGAGEVARRGVVLMHVSPVRVVAEFKLA